MLLKQLILFLVIVALSAVVVMFEPQTQHLLRLLVDSHEWVAEMLTEVFNGGPTGNIIREMVALLCVPVLAGLVPAIIYLLMRKRWLPCFMEIIWMVWLLQTGALVMIYSVPAATEPAPIATPAKEKTTETIPAPPPEPEHTTTTETPAAAPEAPATTTEPAPAATEPPAPATN